MNNQFKPQQYFDLESFLYKDIFKGTANVWEVLPKINTFSKGTLLQGKNCTIASSALIRQGVILGDNVHIGHCVELKNCIILNNTSIAHLNYIGDSVIGNTVNIAGGAMCANFRFDKKKITVQLPNKKTVSSGLLKMGAIIGDNSKIGCNCVLNPGTILGKHTIVYPLVSVRGVHKDNMVIK